MTDVGPGDKLMSVFHDASAKYVRFDTTDINGDFTSITVDFTKVRREIFMSKQKKNN